MENGDRGYGTRGYSDVNMDYHRTQENSPSDREPRGRWYAMRTFGDRQSGRGYNRGYGRGPNYGNQDNRSSRDSSVEP